MSEQKVCWWKKLGDKFDEITDYCILFKPQKNNK